MYRKLYKLLQYAAGFLLMDAVLAMPSSYCDSGLAKCPPEKSKSAHIGQIDIVMVTRDIFYSRPRTK